MEIINGSFRVAESRRRRFESMTRLMLVDQTFYWVTISVSGIRTYTDECRPLSCINAALYL